MAVIEVNKNPSGKDFAIFAGAFTVAFGLVGLLLRHEGHPTGGAVVWAVGAGLLVVFLAVPRLRRPLYLGWIYAFFPLGFVLSHVVLAAIYYLVFTPIGLLSRLVGRDPLRLRSGGDLETYWVRREPTTTDTSRYFRQS